MFVLLIAASLALSWIWISSFLVRRDQPHPLRVGVLLTSLFNGLFVVISTELLSLLDFLQRESVAGVWTMVILLQGGLIRRNREGILRILQVWNRKLRSYRPDRLTVVFGIFLFVVFGSTGVTAFVAPPNNADSMSYHMSRVFFWTENGSIDFFPTRDDRQLFYPPFAEYCILHLQILTGGDRLANLVQWFFFIGCLVACSLIGAELGGSDRHQLLTVVFSASIPMSILQAATTQNDLVASFWVLTFVYFALRHIRGDGPMNWSGAGGGLGLAILTKPTALFAAFPFVLWVIIGAFFTAKGRRILKTAALLILVVLINAPHWTRSFRTYGHPYGSDAHRRVALCVDPGIISLGSNLLRHFAMHFKSSDIPLGVGEPPARKLQTMVEWLHSLAGRSVNETDSTWLDQKFNLISGKGLSFHEDFSGFPVHILILLVSMSCSLHLRRTDRGVLLYLIATMAGFLLLSFLLKWHPWMTRFHVTYALLAAPFAAFLVSDLKKAGLALLVVCATSSFFPLYSSDARPWLGELSVFMRVRDQQYLVNAPNPTRRALAEIPSVLKDRDIRRIGLLLKGASHEYPLFVFMKRRHPNLEFENLGVSEMKGVLGRNAFGRGPELLIANILGGQLIEIEGTFYSKLWGDHGFQIYERRTMDLETDSRVPFRTIREIGFDAWEGPYPEWGIFSEVRWMLGIHAMIVFQPEGPITDAEATNVLFFDAMSHIENQKIRVSINGSEILDVTLGRPHVWQTVVTERFRLKQGENLLRIGCTMSLPNAYDPRDMALLMSEISFGDR